MTDNEIIEAYFVARGWEHRPSKFSPNLNWYVPPDGTGIGIHAPNILKSYPDFKREVLEVMEGEGFKPCIPVMSYDWVWIKVDMKFTEEIIDNEILKAAVITATRYWEQKK